MISATPFFGEDNADNKEIEEPVKKVKENSAHNKNCPKCGEELEKVWDEEWDDWVFLNAVEISENDTIMVCHALCMDQNSAPASEESRKRNREDIGEDEESLVSFL
jgi:hypothetical protein